MRRCKDLQRPTLQRALRLLFRQSTRSPYMEKAPSPSDRTNYPEARPTRPALHSDGARKAPLS